MTGTLGFRLPSRGRRPETSRAVPSSICLASFAPDVEPHAEHRRAIAPGRQPRGPRAGSSRDRSGPSWRSRPGWRRRAAPGHSRTRSHLEAWRHDRPRRSTSAPSIMPQSRASIVIGSGICRSRTPGVHGPIRRIWLSRDCICESTMRRFFAASGRRKGLRGGRSALVVRRCSGAGKRRVGMAEPPGGAPSVPASTHSLTHAQASSQTPDVAHAPVRVRLLNGADGRPARFPSSTTGRARTLIADVLIPVAVDTRPIRIVCPAGLHLAVGGLSSTCRWRPAAKPSVGPSWGLAPFRARGRLQSEKAINGKRESAAGRQRAWRDFVDLGWRAWDAGGPARQWRLRMAIPAERPDTTAVREPIPRRAVRLAGAAGRRVI